MKRYIIYYPFCPFIVPGTRLDRAIALNLAIIFLIVSYYYFTNKQF